MAASVMMTGLKVRGSLIWATMSRPPYRPISGASTATLGLAMSGRVGAA
ncbi:MAG: hypothetical protein ACRDGN_16310 [bacterium]